MKCGDGNHFSELKVCLYFYCVSFSMVAIIKNQLKKKPVRRGSLSSHCVHSHSIILCQSCKHKQGHLLSNTSSKLKDKMHRNALQTDTSSKPFNLKQVSSDLTPLLAGLHHLCECLPKPLKIPVGKTKPFSVVTTLQLRLG